MSEQMNRPAPAWVSREIDAKLRRLVEAAKARFDALSPEEQEKELHAQALSWARQDRD